jgi:hypothetical protein
MYNDEKPRKAGKDSYTLSLENLKNIFFKQGVQYEMGVNRNSRLMLITSLTYFVIQIPALWVDDQKSKSQYSGEESYLNAVVAESSSEKVWAGFGTFIAVTFFCGYMYLQYRAMAKAAPVPVGDQAERSMSSALQMPYSDFLNSIQPSCVSSTLPMEKVRSFGLKSHIDDFRKQYRRKLPGEVEGDVYDIAAMYDGRKQSVPFANASSTLSEPFVNITGGPVKMKLPKGLHDILLEFFHESTMSTNDHRIHE